ncbi:MAG: tetratricopeptide repeat protein [Pseudomonadales bacterium]|jgi:tetratricopeptide (TPR) repeat protein
MTLTLRILLPLTLCAMAAGCGRDDSPAPSSTPTVSSTSAPRPAAGYVGSEGCAACHAAETRNWQGSHHDLALQTATAETVLGHFPDEFDGTRFSLDDQEYRIAPSSGEAPRVVLYTFGVTPLQQYVIPFELGALQTYPVAWDSRPADSGGQRWFHLQEDDYPPGDPMHWTGRANRWNSQCADCHSTGVRKGYDPQTMRYSTTWAVEDVGCEACHGPGSLHVADPAGAPLMPLDTQATQINACAPCHSRRSQLAEGFVPERAYLDYYLPRLLSPELYHVDGQIDDEVYVYGSFLQSRMHLAGVTCSNCHDAHGATLKRPGNETCTLCHQQAPAAGFAAAAGRYDTSEHHFHPPGSPGAECVACHMPSKTYMKVDDRRDHSFRIPRPDLAVTLGVPEPCTGCHADRTAAWAAGVIRGHFGEDRPRHFAGAFAAADAAEPGADAALAALVGDPAQPIMVRASALARLGAYDRGHTLDAIREARNGGPLLRLAAPRAAQSLNPQTRWRLLAPLLDDELRAVRSETVSALLPTLAADPAFRSRLAPYLTAWEAEQTLNLDFPETLTNLASAHMLLGQPQKAEADLEEALRQQPSWVPGLTNLADVYRVTGREAEAGELLERALALAPDQPEVPYAYALWLARQGRLPEGLPYFQRAAEAAPDQTRFGYAWAIALNDSGDGKSAVRVLTDLLERWPDDERLLLATASMLRDQGRYSEALPLVDRLISLRPEDRQLRQFRDALAAAAAR